MTTQQYDYLIIGQGLAGSLLAFALIQRGQRVLVVDNNLYGSSSQVAAGLINPITGHRLNLNHDFNDHLNNALAFYDALAQEFKGTFITSIEQRRLIKNAGQSGYFDQRCEQADYKAYLSRVDTPDFTTNDYGSAAVHRTYAVDTKALLIAAKTWLIKRNSYLNQSINYDKLINKDNNFVVNDNTAKHVVFCEGYQAIHNPWLCDLPFKLAKGEILTLELESHCPSMLSWGNWLVPQTSNTAKLGSNYAWESIDLTPSDTVKTKLMDSLQHATHHKGRIIKHEVGVRPTTKLRQALVGPLSNLDRAYCFNGFGSKGCLTIPWHVRLLCDHLLEKNQLPIEVTQCL